MYFTFKVTRNLCHQFHSNQNFEPVPLLDGGLNGTGRRVGKYTDRESRSVLAYVSKVTIP